MGLSTGLNFDLDWRHEYLQLRWTPVTEPPRNQGYYYTFIPDLGNEDEGYGYVLIALYRDNLLLSFTQKRQSFIWFDPQRQEEIKPAFWADILMPEPPYLSDDPVTVEEALALL